MTASTPDGASMSAASPSVLARIVHRRLDDRSLVLRICGELDVESAPKVGAEVAAAQAMVEEVWLDLRQVTFIDSTGLCMLVEADARARHHAAHRVSIVCGAAGPARRLFEMTGLHEHLTLADQPPDEQEHTQTLIGA